MIKKRKLTLMQLSTMDSFLADVNVYMRRHKSALFRTQFRLKTVNYHLFSHGDVSYRFNGKNDNIVLEFEIIHRYFFLFLHKNISCTKVRVPTTYILVKIYPLTRFDVYETLCPQQMLVHKGGQIKNWSGECKDIIPTK